MKCPINNFADCVKEECPLWKNSRECGLYTAIDSLQTIAGNLDSIDYSCEQIANSR